MPDNTHTADHAAPSGKSTLRRGAWLLLPLLAFSAPAWSAHKAKVVSKCLAGICLQSATNKQDIVAQYGPGFRSKPFSQQPAIVRRCYYDAKQNLYIAFSFDSNQRMHAAYHSGLTEIMLSSVPMCAKRNTAWQPFPPLKTENGVGIGTSKAKLQAAMGSKGRAINVAARAKSSAHSHQQQMAEYDAADYGEKALRYQGGQKKEPLSDTFFLHDGKVSAIDIRNSK